MAQERPGPIRPAGEKKTVKTAVLEAGADLLQPMTPLKQFDIYVVGFHCAKLDPAMQMEAHHYCSQVNEDFIQCMLFDGNTRDANLLGIEYIVSERLFNDLPEEEKGYWHPHNYEILSGQLVAPGLPEIAEKALMRLLINSYGKTWHVWHTGTHYGGPGDPLPYGDPRLMWSFNRDGEAIPAMEHNREAAMEIDTAGKRRDRADLVELTHPQMGVNALQDAFPRANPHPPAGVRDITEQR